MKLDAPEALSTIAPAYEGGAAGFIHAATPSIDSKCTCGVLDANPADQTERARFRTTQSHLCHTCNK